MRDKARESRAYSVAAFLIAVGMAVVCRTVYAQENLYRSYVSADGGKTNITPEGVTSITVGAEQPCSTQPGPASLSHPCCITASQAATPDCALAINNVEAPPGSEPYTCPEGKVIDNQGRCRLGATKCEYRQSVSYINIEINNSPDSSKPAAFLKTSSTGSWEQIRQSVTVQCDQGGEYLVYVSEAPPFNNYASAVTGNVRQSYPDSFSVICPPPSPFESAVTASVDVTFGDLGNERTSPGPVLVPATRCPPGTVPGISPGSCVLPVQRSTRSRVTNAPPPDPSGATITGPQRTRKCVPGGAVKGPFEDCCDGRGVCPPDNVCYSGCPTGRGTPSPHG